MARIIKSKPTMATLINPYSMAVVRQAARLYKRGLTAKLVLSNL